MAGRMPHTGELFYSLDTATGGWGATAEEDGALRTTAYRFCASREGLEPTGAFAFVPA